MYDFAGKVVLVTGANRGIGKALVKAFASHGSKICVVARTSESARNVALELRREFGTDAIGSECDVRNYRRVQNVIDDTIRRLGGLDIMVNNAGELGQIADLAKTDPNSWHSVIDTNLNGSFYFAHAVLPPMRRQKSGRIVFVSSSVGREARPNWGAYSVSKWAVEGLMKLIAAENPDTGVATCSVNPGGTATEMRRQAFPQEDPTTLPTAENVAAAFLNILRQENAQINGRAFDARKFLEAHS
jgi:NAD(P)-dependent dehydrogenase (short-subunit alcohol dehydrogenase family)